MTSRNFHEDLARHGEEPRASERNLGVTFAVVLALVAALKFYRGDGAALYWLAGAAAFLACAYLWTAPLRPLNFVWHRLGLRLGEHAGGHRGVAEHLLISVSARCSRVGRQQSCYSVRANSPNSLRAATT